MRGAIIVFAALSARTGSATRHINVGLRAFLLRRRLRPRGQCEDADPGADEVSDGANGADSGTVADSAGIAGAGADPGLNRCIAWNSKMDEFQEGFLARLETFSW